MRAVVLGAELAVGDWPRPAVAADEALVRVTLAGICNTDIELARGYMAFQGVLGHEFVGIVEAAPDPTWVGARVVGEINAYCASCAVCLAGRATHCPHRTTLGIVGRDGALAEYLTLPLRNLHRVPDSVTDVAAVFTEPLAAAVEILDQVHVQPSQRIVVLGDGKLGLLIAQVMALTGADVTLVGRHRAKLALVERKGIAVAVGADEVRDGADMVVEVTGSPAGFDTARRLVRPRGVLVLKSTYAGDHGGAQAGAGLNMMSGLVVDEIQVVGSRCGPFAPALRLLAGGRVEVESMVNARYPLGRALEAFEHAQRPGVLKVLVDPTVAD